MTKMTTGNKKAHKQPERTSKQLLGLWEIKTTEDEEAFIEELTRYVYGDEPDENTKKEKSKGTSQVRNK